jgi:hypothetical protein
VFIKEALDELGEPVTRGSLDAYVPAKEYLEQVAELVIRDGYISATKAEEQLRQCTADAAYHVFLKRFEPEMGEYQPTEKAKKLARATIDFVQSKKTDQSSNYLNNLNLVFDAMVFKEKYIRLVASSVAYYNNELQKEKTSTDQKDKQFIGKEGEKITFTGTVARMNTFESQFGLLRIYLINDANGNAIVWKSATNAEIEIGSEYTITATVKKHSLFKDQYPQTEITRPKFAIKNEIFTQEVMQQIDKDASIFGNIKGKEAIDKICANTNEKYMDHLLKNYAGLSNISVYLNEASDSKHGKEIAELDVKGIFMLSRAIMGANYHNQWDVKNTNKFIKNNKELYETIVGCNTKKTKNRERAL